MKVKSPRTLFAVAIIGVTLLSIFFSLPGKNILGQNYIPGVCVEAELVDSSDDAEVKVISPEGHQDIFTADQGMPTILVNSTIEVLNGSLIVLLNF